MIKWGIVGLGNMAQKFANAIKETNNAKLLSISSLNSEKLKSFANNFQIDKNYVISWSYQNHIIVILIIIILTIISGFSLQKTDAVYPYLDSFTTWASVVTTFMVAQKILSNWIFWIIINSIAIFLNFDRELYLTVILLMTYQVMSVYGYYQWRKSYYDYKSQN